jgi:putative flavoprotein involved in K+ transport
MTSRLQNDLVGATDVIVIGAGHAGLAMSHYLSARSIDHIVLERGEVANSWRTERWDSLRLLTPNWMNTLPGKDYSGLEPNGFMNMQQVIRLISGYAANIQAPVRTRTVVLSVVQKGEGYRVHTNQGAWQTRALVIASGACNLPSIPAIHEAIPSSVSQISSFEYRNPERLGPGPVLVVGASATGVQLAEEIQASGRDVTVAVGEHVRLPRVYRGNDIQWWMKTIGLMDERLDSSDDIVRLRNLSSPQLIGSAERRSLDLNILSSRGVRLVGKLAGVRGNKAQFSGSLRNVCMLADLKMARLLDSIDNWIDAYGYASDHVEDGRPDPTRVEKSPLMSIGLGRDGIETIVWATGYRPDYSWLNVPVFDRKGRIRHSGGVVDQPGVYVLGLPFLRRRKSTFIHGGDDDARELCSHLHGYLDRTTRAALFKAVV